MWLWLTLTFDLMTTTTFKHKWQTFYPGAHLVIHFFMSQLNVNHAVLNQALPLSENQLTVAYIKLLELPPPDSAK